MSFGRFDNWVSLDLTTTVNVKDIAAIPPAVANYAALSGINNTKYTTARTLGYYAKGDGGDGIYNYVNGAWVLAHDGYVSVLQFGAKSDGSLTGGTDNTAAFNAAFAVAKEVYVPEGNYRITNVITIPAGGILRGAGRVATNLFITSTYTNVAGFIKMNHASELYDIGFNFAQPDTNVRANFIQYPWAVNFQDCNRVIIDRIRISGGYNGLYGPGNTGGAYIGFVEIGVINNGMLIGGALDFFNIVKYHFWPFGFSASTNQMAVYGDGNTTAMTVGAVDGFNVENLATFQGKVVFTNDATAVIPYLVGNLQLDGDGSRLLAQNGTISIGKYYDTKSNASTVQSLLLTNNAIVDIGYARVSSNASAYSMYVQDNAKLHVHGGDIQCVNAAGGAIYIQAGIGIIEDTSFNPAPNTITYANGYCVAGASGVLKVRGCRWSAKGSSNGVGIVFASSNALHEAINNSLNGWEFSFNTAGRQAGHFEGNINTVSSFYNNNLIGNMKRCAFLGTTDNSGNATIATGVSNLHQLIFEANAVFKQSANGQAVRMTISSIDSAGNVYISGGTAAVSVRLHIGYVDVALPNW